MFMRRMVVGILAVGVIGFFLPGTAAAQSNDVPSYEVFGGFTYSILDTGAGFGIDEVGATGAQGQFTFFVNDWFGIGGEVGYSSGEIEIPAITIFPPIDADVSVSYTTFLFGPRFRLGGTERFQVGAQALVGASRARTDLEGFAIALPERFGRGFFGAQNFRNALRNSGDRIGVLRLDETALAMAFGVNFDLKVNDRISWRIIQPDVLVTRFGNGIQTQFRFSTGFVFGF